MIDLGTNGLNNLGEVIGFSENVVRDDTCGQATPNQVFQFEPVRWGPRGKIHSLNPLPGDSVGFAFGINNAGRAVGTSGQCNETSLPPNAPMGPHAVLWDKEGNPTDLGALGQNTYPNVGTSINNLGQVTGAAGYPDGTIHAFIWTSASGMQDLGVLNGAIVTVAPCCNTINDRGQIVGFWIDGSGNERAFIWHNGIMTDLNTLIPENSPWILQSAQAINDAGEIVGFGTINGDIHAFLAIPR